MTRLATNTGRLATWGAVLLGILVAHPRAQNAAAPTAPTLVVGGAVSHPLRLSAADLKGMTRTSVTVTDSGRTTTYDGVLVGDILTHAGAPIGGAFSGPAVASYVLATAKDGYEVVFSLGELDPALNGNDILLADTANGQPLPETQGPFRIVVPHDTRGARSIRMLERLDVVRLRP